MCSKQALYFERVQFRCVDAAVGKIKSRQYKRISNHIKEISMGWWWAHGSVGYTLFIAIIAPNASLQDHKFTQQGVYQTEQACKVAASQIGEAQLKLLRKSKEEWKDAKFESLCVASKPENQ